MSMEKLSPLGVPFVGGIPSGEVVLVDFYGTPTTVEQFEIVSFYSTIDISVNVLSVLWDFGDGETNGLLNPTHGYHTSGQFTVTLTVYRVEGGSIVEQKYFYITVTDAGEGIPDFADRADNLLIEEVRKQYGVNRTSPPTADEIIEILPTPPVEVELVPITDFSDRAVNLLNENVRKIYGEG